jgi:hypothetical protein
LPSVADHFSNRLTLPRNFPARAKTSISSSFFADVHGMLLHFAALPWHFNTLTKH